MKVNAILKVILAITLSLMVGTAHALIFPLPERGDDVVGDLYLVRVEEGDTLNKIARAHNISLQDLMAANPNVDPKRLKISSEIIIPGAYILPPVERKGIIINLAEMRLYYFPRNENIVFTAPVGIGREGWETPLGKTRIIEKIEQPEWNVPKSIREHSLKKGIVLPEVVPPGPDNPLGDYAMRLGKHAYLIHGTNAPHTVGKRSSSGCIRMYPWDVEILFYMVARGTPVQIINEPVKIGRYQGELYAESHPKMYLEQAQSRYRRYPHLPRYTRYYRIHWDYLRQVKAEQLGYPRLVGWER